MRRFVLTALLLGWGSPCLIFQARAYIDSTLQMQLGNPSGAIADTNNHDHYLIQRTVEAIDYSDNLGEPVWASWDLTAGDVGSVPRSTTYRTDTNLPPNFYRVTDNDYNGVGNIDFNRGHLCPSEDRTDTTNDNRLVFFMTNIMPQSGPNNQGVWANFEDYCRGMLTTNELLIICGPSGFGTNRIPSGKACIPSNTWKVVVCAPLGGGTALSRLTTMSRVIAISVPNVTNGLSTDWHSYLTSPQQIEHDTGFIFFTALPTDLAAAFRARIDGSPAPGITNFSPAAGSAGTSVVIQGTNFSGTTTVWFNGTKADFTLNSSNQITATVPADASTGPLSVIAEGGVAASAGSFIVTTAVVPGFKDFSLTSGQFTLTVTGGVSASFTITATTNLADPQWTTLLTTNPASLPFTFVDTNRLTQRFYRVQNP